MGRSVARWPTPHLKASTLRNSDKCSCYDRLRSNNELDVIVVSIYFKVAHHGGAIPSERQTTFDTRRSWFAPINNHQYSSGGSWWRRRALPPGPQYVLTASFIAIAGKPASAI